VLDNIKFTLDNTRRNRKSTSSKYKNFLESGLTIVELVVVTAIAGLLIASTLTVMLFFYGDTLRANLQSQLAVESQGILRSVVEELRLSSGIKASNTNDDPNAPAGGWTTSNSDLILIISTPVLDSSNEFIFDPLTGSPYQNEIVYFAVDNILYKRFLANTDASGNTMKTSCPHSSASPSCPPDVELSQNFETMNFMFYDQDNNSTTVLANARSIEITIEMLRAAFGKDIEFDNNIRITLRNTVL
jgi:type II secretory pathway pseudopilin PulG